MKKYPYVPGRGLVNHRALKDRLEHLSEQGIETRNISSTSISSDSIKNNIESNIGSVEIPIGLAGPLLFNDAHNSSSFKYAPIGTLEGALVASINRGAYVVSKCSGISSHVIHQKMVRSPLFMFTSIQETVQFKNWVLENSDLIKTITERHTNHGKLVELNPVISGRNVHLKFIYTTGDASGQNMTTNCTARAIEWIEEKYEESTAHKIQKVVIEGNGSSDKKISNYSINQGRGVHVIAECELEESQINKVLRTTSDEFIKSYNASVSISRLDGMIGHNLNVANVIAAIFVSTGQDLACIHESSIGILTVEKTEKGLYLNLHLPTLVIGTIGGGTHLSKQKEALELMGCYGKGKVEEFAKMIAGFALALEISTFAAIVGGQFASAHERLGRNKPKNWLTKSDIDVKFVQNGLINEFEDQRLKSVDISPVENIADGWLVSLARKATNKQIGQTLIDVSWHSENKMLPAKILINSNPLSSEMMLGLQKKIAETDVELSRLLVTYEDELEFHNSHLKDIEITRFIANQKLGIAPTLYGFKIDTDREIYISYLQSFKELQSENPSVSSEKWSSGKIENAINTIHIAHSKLDKSILRKITVFDPIKSPWLYRKQVELVKQNHQIHSELQEQLDSWLVEIEKGRGGLAVQDTVIHNEYTAENIALNSDNEVVIKNWGLSVENLPQRDVIELLCDVLPEGFSEDLLTPYLNIHFNNWKELYSIDELLKATVYALKEYLITRVCLYLIITKDENRIESINKRFNNAVSMIGMLENELNQKVNSDRGEIFSAEIFNVENSVKP